MIETEINTHLESIKEHLRTTTRVGDNNPIPMKSAVTEGIDFLWQYFKHPKNRSNYPVKFSETKRVFTIGVDGNMLGGFDSQKLSQLENNIQRSQSIMSDRSKQGQSPTGNLNALTDTSQHTEVGEFSKLTQNRQYRQKEESLHNKIIERLRKMDKSRENMAAKLDINVQNNSQALSSSKGRVSIKGSQSIVAREASLKVPKLPPINNPANSTAAEPSKHIDDHASKTLRTLLRLRGSRVEGNRHRKAPKPVPHSFFSLLDRSREQSVERSLSASRHRSSRSQAPENTRKEAAKGPQYSLLFE